MKSFKQHIIEYRKPTQAEIDADKKKDRAGKSRPSMTNKSINKKLYVNMQPKLKEEKVGDTCSCCDNKIDENGKCGCGPDCSHCGGSHDVSEAGCSSSLNASTKYSDKMKKVKESVEEVQLDELTAAEKKLVDQMYDKKGNLTPLGKKVMNHGKKPGDKGYMESLGESEVNDITAEYINENNISIEQLENMTEEELNELIGKAIGGAFKVAAKTAVGTGRLAKKAANRMSTSGRAAAAEKKADSIEKKNADRARIKAAQQRVRDAKRKARENK